MQGASTNRCSGYPCLSNATLDVRSCQDALTVRPESTSSFHLDLISRTTCRGGKNVICREIKLLPNCPVGPCSFLYSSVVDVQWSCSRALLHSSKLAFSIACDVSARILLWELPLSLLFVLVLQLLEIGFAFSRSFDVSLISIFNTVNLLLVSSDIPQKDCLYVFLACLAQGKQKKSFKNRSTLGHVWLQQNNIKDLFNFTRAVQYKGD